MFIGKGGRAAIFAAAGAAAALAGAPAAAGSGTATLGVSATVEASCSVSAGAVEFGSVDLDADGARTGTGIVRVACSNGTGWTAAADTAAGVRRMTGAAGELAYRLYTDAGRTRAWGDGSGGTATLSGSGTGAPQSYEVHGEILPDQNGVRAGDYADRVVVTITY